MDLENDSPEARFKLLKKALIELRNERKSLKKESEEIESSISQAEFEIESKVGRI